MLTILQNSHLIVHVTVMTMRNGNEFRIGNRCFSVVKTNFYIVIEKIINIFTQF